MGGVAPVRGGAVLAYGFGYITDTVRMAGSRRQAGGVAGTEWRREKRRLLRFHRPANQATDLAPQDVGFERLEQVVGNTRLDGLDHVLTVGWAITMRIGTWEPVSRIKRVKSRPDMPGICQSTTTASNWSLSNRVPGLLPVGRLDNLQVGGRAQGHADKRPTDGVIVSNQDFHQLDSGEMGMDWAVISAVSESNQVYVTIGRRV